MGPILWFGDKGAEDAALVGSKAARLAALLHDGHLVPPGFCVTTTAYESFLSENDLTSLVETGRAADMQAAILSGHLSMHLLTELNAALSRLAAEAPAGEACAVRSSSPVEDLAGASFAGQYETYLNVPPADVPARVLACWASLWNERARAYRQHHGLPPQTLPMAVVVQAMIPCDVSGVAFSVDPFTGDPTIVIEAAPGLSQAVVSGRATPHRYVIERQCLTTVGDDLLTPDVLRQLADTVLAIEKLFACPQDVEWGLWQGRLYIFQTRPVSALSADDDIFTEPADAQTLWTSAFFSERFPQPVSPLGWSLLREPIERYALADPLRFMGVAGCESWPLTRLYRGHPYASVQAFQTFYKVFPDWLLPEDAQRFFPHKDVGLRRKVPHPKGILDPRFLVSMLRHFLHDPRNWSPLHNAGLWQQFTQEYDAALAAAQARLDRPTPSELLAIAAEIQTANGRLLAIHRWSLTDADIFYSLLRRLLRSWVSTADYGVLAAALTSGEGNLSVESNEALDRLAVLAYNLPHIPQPAGGSNSVFQTALHDFLARYGHRSPSLDIYHPTLADDPRLVLALVEGQVETLAPTGRGQGEGQDAAHSTLTPPLSLEGRGRVPLAVGAAEDTVHATLTRNPLERLLPVRWLVLRVILALARRYLPLRENQRFYWQKGLALLRRVYVRLGECLVARGLLARADDVFFLTAGEVERLCRGDASGGCGVSAAKESAMPPDASPIQLAARRRVVFQRLCNEWKAAPQASYPPFLQGDLPLTADSARGNILIGRAVSPGLARGQVCVVLTPDDFVRVPTGSILVVPSADPAWTVLFPRLAGLVLESGGQLSHGAVVAREYGLPAVAGIPGVTGILHDGESVIVDGTRGTVTPA